MHQLYEIKAAWMGYKATSKKAVAFLIALGDGFLSKLKSLPFIQYSLQEKEIGGRKKTQKSCPTAKKTELSLLQN